MRIPCDPCPSRWNASSFWMHDSENGRARFDTMNSKRALSSGSYFERDVHSEVTVDGVHYDVDNLKSSCAQDTNASFYTSTSACVGDITRFMPPEARAYNLGTGTDELLNSSVLVDGIECDVYGWDEELYPGSPADKMHRVWIDSMHGFPVREYQASGLVTGYSIQLFAAFSWLEDIQGSFSYMQQCPAGGCIFEVPSECT